MGAEASSDARHIPVKVVFLLGIVAVVALPLVVAIIVTGLLPDIGRTRPGGEGWRLLHLLWIYPVFAFVTWFVLEPIARRVGRATSHAAEVATETVLAWLLLCALLGVFFEHTAGAAVASAIAIATLRPFTYLLERTAPRDEDPRPA